MSENGNVESLSVRLLQEMRAGIEELRTGIAEVRTELAEVRAEVREVRAEVREVRTGLADFKQEMREFRQKTEQRLDVFEPAAIEIIGAVRGVIKTQDEHSALLLAHNEMLGEVKRSQNVMEKDMRGLRGRVERIEDSMGLVKA